MYVVVVHFVVGMEKLVLLVSTTIFLGSGRRRSIMCMLQQGGRCLFWMEPQPSHLLLKNVSKISRLGYLGHFILLRTRYKMSRRAPLLPILNGKCRPTTCGGWGDRMDSNDGGCVQSWMTGWLGSWTHRNFFFFLLQRYWVTLEFFNLLSRYIYLPTYLSLSESHCKWWYLSINNLMKLVLLTYVCY